MAKGIRRRELVRRGASGIGALGLAQVLSACGSGASPGPALPDLSDLDRAIGGRVVVPGSRRYRAARLVWNRRYDDARPVAVVQPESADDVRRVVDFARANEERLIIRSGGHSFAGYSTGDGLVLDLSGLNDLTVGRDGTTATLGAGATTLATYRALWSRRVAISGGTCPTVGIPGLTAGGGLGVLSRREGLTCDNLVEVEVVTADGRIVRANERDDPDLLWATRGGGGGNFGVITALTFRLVPVDTPFTFAEYGFPWSAVERVVDAWQAWLPTSPWRTWSAVELATTAPGAGSSPDIAIELVHAGPEGELRSAVHDLLGAAGAPPSHTTTHSGPFVDIESGFYCKGLRPKECTLEGKTAAGEFPRVALYSKSDVASGPWPREGISALKEWIEKRQRDPTLTPNDFSPAHTIGKVLIEAADGAVNAPAPDATAFVHRDNLFVSQYQARWRPGTSKRLIAANLEWADGLYRAIEPYRSGFAYQDYIDARLEDWEHAYYGANLTRLRSVKSKYDPTDFFRFAQSIPRA